MTTRVELNPDTWTEISSAAAGYMDNEGQSIVKYRVEDAPPSDAETWGHKLDLEKGIGWSRAVAKPIFGRTVTQKGFVIVTEG
ncbi:hypothetical protein [Vibrio sp. McD22-P3]|uniref:hypothetical protein n=1 Tax=Vibrio sp. McD22-P3 TaxID=2724880 RepID=UPI001F33E977|nr:hypothetical protein [Vibrio sp. McD22-P3]MCF4173535.1 hypothetical protein [Vibrio sp. McD22-P3]